MARSVNTDFFQNMYFMVTATNGTDDFLQRDALSVEAAQAGFQSCTIPSVSNDPVEYREGTFIYTRKQPGLPSMDQITLARGVARKDTSFYGWLRIVNEGEGNYRADVTIQHFHRAVSLKRPPRDVNKGSGTNQTAILADAVPGREYIVHEAFPSMVKLAGDLDGTSSDISIQEVQLEYEYVEVVEHDF